MKEIGQKLKQAREARGLLVHEVGLLLKINPKILIAIEEGDVQKLPSKTFLRGFIKSYSTLLKMDTSKIMSEFSIWVGDSPTVKIQSNHTPTNTQILNTTPTASDVIKKSTSFETPKQNLKNVSSNVSTSEIQQESSVRPWTVFVSLGLLILIIFVYKMVDKYSKEKVIATNSTVPIQEELDPQTPPTEPEKVAIAPTAVEVKAPAPVEKPAIKDENPMAIQNVVDLISSAANLENPTVNMTPLKTVPSVPTGHQAAIVKAPIEKPTVAEIKVPSPIEKPAVEIKVEEIKKPIVAETAIEKKESLLEIILEAKKEVSIEYNFGKEPAQKLSLASGQVHTFKSKKPIDLQISDGGAVSVIVNGVDRGKAGSDGQSIKLSYPR
jgi:cytoskeleton protein RodZ